MGVVTADISVPELTGLMDPVVLAAEVIALMDGYPCRDQPRWDGSPCDGPPKTQPRCHFHSYHPIEIKGPPSAIAGVRPWDASPEQKVLAQKWLRTADHARDQNVGRLKCVLGTAARLRRWLGTHPGDPQGTAMLAALRAFLRGKWGVDEVPPSELVARLKANSIGSQSYYRAIPRRWRQWQNKPGGRK